MNRRAFLGGVVATAAATALIPVPKPARRAVTSPAQDLHMQPIVWPILYGRISDTWSAMPEGATREIKHTVSSLRNVDNQGVDPQRCVAYLDGERVKWCETARPDAERPHVITIHARRDHIIRDKRHGQVRVFEFNYPPDAPATLPA